MDSRSGTVVAATALVAVVLGPRTQAQAPSAIVVEEFDGVSPNGVWERQNPGPDFPFNVTPTQLEMFEVDGPNQHLVRRDTSLDPNRPYAMDCRFTLDSAAFTNSFALNFQQDGFDGDTSPINTWSMNVDTTPFNGPVMKYMGFVEGNFTMIGSRLAPWAQDGQEYRMRVAVNTRLSGEHVLDWVTVTVWEGTLRREHFEVDYSSFPYQPDPDQPTRIGANSHGADWTMRNLRVTYLDGFVASNQAPIAVAGADLVAAPGQRVGFDASASSDPDGTPLADLVCTWDCGDGNVYEALAPTHTYSRPGVYTVTLAVSDGLETSTDTLRVAVGSDVLFHDDFEADYLVGWLPVDPGTQAAYQLDAGRFRAIGDCTATAGALGTAGLPTQRDVSVEALVLLQDPAGGWAGVSARRAQSDHFGLESGYLGFINRNGVVNLFVAGQGTATPPVLTGLDPTSEPARLRMDVEGDRIDVFVNDELVITHVDGTYPAAGFVGVATAEQDVLFDEFTVRSLDPAHTFGTPQTNSLGGVVALDTTGTPSASGAFRVTADGLQPGTLAVLFVGGSPLAAPGVISGGWYRLVQGPLWRSSTRTAGTDGSLEYVYDELRPGQPGATQYYQLFYRDLGDPNGFAVTDAVRVTFQ